MGASGVNCHIFHKMGQKLTVCVGDLDKVEKFYRKFHLRKLFRFLQSPFFYRAAQAPSVVALYGVSNNKEINKLKYEYDYLSYRKGETQSIYTAL